MKQVTTWRRMILESLSLTIVTYYVELYTWLRYYHKFQFDTYMGKKLFRWPQNDKSSNNVRDVMFFEKEVEDSNSQPRLRNWALDWNVWNDIGKEFVVKCNINDWVVCQPNDGGTVEEKGGSINCQNLKNVATACSGVGPYRIKWCSRGPSLNASSYYYFFMEAQIITGQLMILVAKMMKVTRKVSAIMVNKSIFVRSQTFTVHTVTVICFI